ncbi:hypothetical protein T06_5511 [Trichinella sp. T6]|nr:hypothetical protein T06_5511 [Trichinella sp. T6]
MQMRIAITLPYLYVQRMEQRKCENTDGTKQNKRRQEKRRSENGDDTKQNKRRQSSWDSNYVGSVSKGRIYSIKSLIKRKALNGGDTKRNGDGIK